MVGLLVDGFVGEMLYGVDVGRSHDESTQAHEEVIIAVPIAINP